MARGDQGAASRTDRHRLYRDRTCIAALEDFLDRAARPQTLRLCANPIRLHKIPQGLTPTLSLSARASAWLRSLFFTVSES